MVPLASSLMALMIMTVTMTVEPITRALEIIRTRDVTSDDGLGRRGTEM